MNIMTDKEIIKAIEICYTPGFSCKECPYTYPNCEDQFIDDVCNLVLSQQKEIERLQEILKNRDEADRIAVDAYEQLLYENDYLQGEIEKYRKELEELNAIEEQERKEALEDAKRNSALFMSMVEYAQAQAIKEFVKAIEERLEHNWDASWEVFHSVMGSIHELAVSRGCE